MNTDPPPECATPAEAIKPTGTLDSNNRACAAFILNVPNEPASTAALVNPLASRIDGVPTSTVPPVESLPRREPWPPRVVDIESRVASVIEFRSAPPRKGELSGIPSSDTSVDLGSEPRMLIDTACPGAPLSLARTDGPDIAAAAGLGDSIAVGQPPHPMRRCHEQDLVRNRVGADVVFRHFNRQFRSGPRHSHAPKTTALQLGRQE